MYFVEVQIWYNGHLSIALPADSVLQHAQIGDEFHGMYNRMIVKVVARAFHTKVEDDLVRNGILRLYVEEI